MRDEDEHLAERRILALELVAAPEGLVAELQVVEHRTSEQEPLMAVMNKMAADRKVRLLQVGKQNRRKMLRHLRSKFERFQLWSLHHSNFSLGEAFDSLEVRFYRLM